MAPNLILAPEAEQDLDEAYAWYENQRRGLGEDFLSCVEVRARAIQKTPLAFKVVFDNYRRALVRRFPYLILFEFIDDTVTIYGVFHTSRDPAKWRQRVDKASE